MSGGALVRRIRMLKEPLASVVARPTTEASMPPAKGWSFALAQAQSDEGRHRQTKELANR